MHLKSGFIQQCADDLSTVAKTVPLLNHPMETMRAGVESNETKTRPPLNVLQVLKGTLI
jgi:hypothetical protein